MGKTVGGGSTGQKQVRMKGALGKHIGRYLDQYTIICVFGSVVGYAVMPLIGTVETLLLSVIVIGLSIHGLSKNSHKEDDRRRSKEDRKTKKQDSKKSVHVQVITDSEAHRRQKEDTSKVHKDQKTLEEEEEAERLRRLEEKREKKTRKKVERNKRREEEKKEKEREEQTRKEKQEQRALKKQQEKEAKEKAKGFLFPAYETIKAMVTTRKPVRRERKHSTSSNSSGSSYTYSHRSHPLTPPRPHPLPTRASSDPILYPSTKPAPWSLNTVDSATTTFPSLPVSEQSILPWSHHPHTVTSSTPNVWPDIEVAPTPPEHTSTAVQNTWGNQTTPNIHPPRWAGQSVETLTPNQTWFTSQSQAYPSTVSDPSLWQNFDVWQDNRQQNDGLSPLISPNGNFYSLFSNNTSSPFIDFQSSSTSTSGHVMNTERRLDDDNLAGRNNEESKNSQSGYDEWPSI